MAIIDTAEADNGSIESVMHDMNEMALGWFSAVTGKGVVQGPGYVAGVAPGTTTLAEVQAPVTGQILQTPFFQSPLVIVAVLGLVVILALHVK